MHVAAPSSTRRIPLIAALTFALAACGGGQDDASSDATVGRDDRVQAQALPPATASLARWSPPATLSLVPVAGAVLPNGNVMLWSAEERMSFGATGRTYTSLYSPGSGTFTERLVSNTGHDMFCPGTSNLPDGRILVNGGIDSGKTSIYDPTSNSWSIAAGMNIARGYNSNTVLQDGSVFTLGGSWSGGVGNKHGEVWTASDGWRRLSGVPVDAMWAGLDTSRNFGNDSHMWLVPTGNGRVLYAGPGVNMQWISTNGNGSVEFAGKRDDDEFSINGTAVMYDTGKILKNGGAPLYEGANANANSYVIDVSNGVSVRKIAPMAYRRAFHNDVVLPNGQVVAIGGQTFEQAFTDNNSVLAPELFDPATESWTTLPPMKVPRNYHSIALLLPDARVLAGGGGLCGGCNANHPDVEILSPHYLFNADGSAATRPVISAAPSSVGYGTTMNVTVNAAVSSFSMVRIGSATHTVNNDQRRVSLEFSANGNDSYSVSVPSNPGILLPGYWMLFAMNERGVPSVAKMVRVDHSASPKLTSPTDQSSSVGSSVNLPLVAIDPTGSSLTYAATGLPPGLSIDRSTGVVSGTPIAVGRTAVTVSASNGGQTVSTNFFWSVSDPGSTRFVKLEATGEVTGQPWTSMAEFNLLDAKGQLLSRGAWTVAADSEELAGENGAAANAVDGNAATFWHTQWQAASPPLPHSFVVDLGGAFEVGGFRYLPRIGGGNGTIAQYRFFVSADGMNWGTPVAQGNLSDLGAPAAEKTVYLNNVARGKVASQSSTWDPGTADRAVDGNVGGVLADNSVSHTQTESTPWWEVDLATSHQLQAVRLWNRTDCCADRLTNFHVLLSDLPMVGRSLASLLADPAVKRVTYAGTAARETLIALNSSGRYLRIQLDGAQSILQLAEVEAIGHEVVNRAPTITTPAVASLVLGLAVSQGVAADDPDADGLTYAAAGLPTGLAINASTGLISGTTNAEGVFNVTLSVSDGRGGNASTSFTWSVLPAPLAIGTFNVAALPTGKTATYSAPVIGGTGLEYQWDFGDGSAPTPYSTDSSVNHAYPGPGVYSVTLTVRSADGSTTTRSFVQAVTATTTAGKPMGSSSLALEPRGAGSPRLWVVNPDNDSVSVFDTSTRVRLAEINVGSQPRTVAVAPDGRIWVVNKGSASLSVINASSFSTQTIAMPRASMPYGIVFDPVDGSALISLEATGQVARIASNGGVSLSASLGPNPRHLSISANGDRLLVSRFISPPLPGEGTAKVSTTDAAGNVKGGEVVVIAPRTLAIQRTIVLRHSDKLDTTVQGRGLPNYLGAAAISPDGLSAWVPSKQDNVKRGSLRDGRNLDFQNTIRAVSSRIDLRSQAEDFAARVDHDNAGVASAAIYHPNGAYLFVALETNRQVAVLDAARRRELFRLEVGRAPQGLAVSADGRSLFVHNYMDRTVSMLDLEPLIHRGETRVDLVATPKTVTTDKLSGSVLKGKQFFYDARDPRLSRDSYMSCAACHNDGSHDGRTWDFTGLGEGLRNTIALRGRAGAQGFRHWSANFDEIQDFEGQIRNFAQGTGLMSNSAFNTGTRGQSLGDKKAGISGDLDALAAYVGSLGSFSPSPLRNSNGALSTAAQAGRAVFVSKNCASCHGGTTFTNSADAKGLRNVGTLKSTSGTRLYGTLGGIDVPTLRDVWATAPYLHDGSAATLQDAVRAHSTLAISADEAGSVAAYLREIGSEEASAPAATPATGKGLLGRYYGNATLSGNVVASRTEAINFNWGTGKPATGVPANNFSARWTGTIEAPKTGTFYLRTNSDDGVRVWLDNTLVINNWTAHSATYNASHAVSLVADRRYSIRVEYMELTGSAVMSLQWRQPGSTSWQAVPTNRLYAD